ncbi:hypothetical protein FGB62_97g04 [Gracilaria domingensis]|nr:hypothetical protein FGB62_97g04 [Gracilaria domingensis]
MHLLQAGLNALQVRVQIKSQEFSMHAFEQLVRKAADTIQGSKDRRKEREPNPDYRTKEERMCSPNAAMRHFERLSIHGDVARVTAILRRAYKEGGGGSTAVRILPPLQRDIWHFMKHYANDRIPENTDKNEAIVKELNGGLQTDNMDDHDSVVRFIAHPCTHDLLSLPLLVRDVSRLAATNHRSASFLVKCLSLLPDPVEKSVSDCRRSILRKYGYISPTRQCYAYGVCEESVLVACSGDADSVETQVVSLANKGDKNVILPTIDAFCHRDLTLLTGDHAKVQNNLSTMASFMVSLGEGGIATEWGSISDHTVQKFVAKSQIFEWPANQQLKRQLEAAFVPAIRWVEQPERDLMVRLMPPSSAYSPSGMNSVTVLKGDGSVVGNWILLEGYGRGANQGNATPPENMWRQRGTIIDKDIARGTVHLKCTYLTFVSLAV